MHEAHEAGLIVFAVLSALGVLAVLLRRLDPLWLLLLHAVGCAVAFVAAVGVRLQAGDGRPLMLAYGAMVLAFALRDGERPMSALRVRVLGAMALTGVAAEGWALAAQPTDAWLRLALGLIAVVAGGAVSLQTMRRARARRASRARDVDHALAASALLVAIAGVLATAPLEEAPGLWPVALGCAGAIVTAVRMPPQVAPPGREWLAAVLLGLLAWVTAEHLSVDGAWHIGLALPLLAIGCLAAVRPLVELAPIARLTSARKQADLRADSAQLQPGVLSFMAPILDDAILRRPGRPRVIVRVPARRLLDAALDRARAVQGLPKSRREELRVEVISGDSDVDIDGDAAELAEALCAVLDNALRMKAQNPEVRVQVHLRGGPGHVTFEVSDALADMGPRSPTAAPNPETPFLGARVSDVERPGLGIGLARARLLVERNGGKLLTRMTEDGSCVQLTIPRRMQKSVVGQA